MIESKKSPIYKTTEKARMSHTDIDTVTITWKIKRRKPCLASICDTLHNTTYIYPFLSLLFVWIIYTTKLRVKIAIIDQPTLIGANFIQWGCNVMLYLSINFYILHLFLSPLIWFLWVYFLVLNRNVLLVLPLLPFLFVVNRSLEECACCFCAVFLLFLNINYWFTSLKSQGIQVSILFFSFKIFRLDSKYF